MRLLILSDIHANSAALMRLCEQADFVAFLGDAVDYGPRPVECVRWAREHADVAVRGNHDNAVGNDADPQCSARFREMAEATRRLHRRMLGPAEKEYLRSLPLQASFELGGARFHAVHAMPSEPLFRYLPPDVSDGELEAELDVADAAHGCRADVLLLGHTHLPLVRRLGKRLVVNPGSLGQPKDGDPRAAYALWEDGEVTLKRCDYPVQETVAQLEAQELPPHIVADLARVLREAR